MTMSEDVQAKAPLPQVSLKHDHPSAEKKTDEPGQAKRYVQEPVAVVGMACRLPGGSSSPSKLWDFLKRGGIASNQPHETRFSLAGHYDGSTKPRTMRSPGGMFLEYVDVRDVDAPFFGLSRTEAIAMDPQVRQVLEVVYEGLENAGIPMESLNGQPVGCFVGSFAGDYADMQARDPEDRVPSVTIGIGRAMLSNRVSHFLNTKGPSMTIDTACSGSLVGLDVACRYLQTGDISGAIVAGCNLYLNPEHNMDLSAMKGANSLSGKCHTFDEKADGYVKAEAVNTVILKRLSDAIRDGDPIRAVIRGSATNSDGYTPGIASPSSEAQAAATRQAYANAGIIDLNNTSYLECHGTGTQAGDPIETNGVSSVFAPSRNADQPLIVGSIKSNVGHSEPAAGLSGLLKAILTLENGIIPGNPTFIKPNPKIDFNALKIRATRTAIPWPKSSFRRASLNSFGYGGSNVHVVVDEPSTSVDKSKLRHISSYAQGESSSDLFGDDEEEAGRNHVLVLSANDEGSLREQIRALTRHLVDPRVNLKLADLSYTLSERRSRHFQRAYIVTDSQKLLEQSFVFGKPNAEVAKVGLVFTGQGAQWPRMGQGLVENFPSATVTLRMLDKVLQTLPCAPKWSLLNEITQPRDADYLRKPELSQPLVTAIQLVILNILRDWNIEVQSVVGHSSGEIAAACAAGYLTPEDAIKIAFHRGQAALETKGMDTPLGMLAVGLGAPDVEAYIQGTEGQVEIACYNSPNSVTLSGTVEQLEQVKDRLQADSHFARLLQVNLAYHSHYMQRIGERYEKLLERDCQPPLSGSPNVKMFSSVTGSVVDSPVDATYWKSNMTQPVRFEPAVKSLLSEEDGANFLIEVGPSGALAGPISQIKKSCAGRGTNAQYIASLKRSSNPSEAIKSLFDVAGQLFLAGGPVNLAAVNQDDKTAEKPKVIVDLPNYSWNHSVKYWYENNASKDWRYRKFNLHDLLGSKILNTSWITPSFQKILNVGDLNWLQDHKMGHEIVFPAAGYIAMAVEAVSQMHKATDIAGVTAAGDQQWHLRNVNFMKALVLTPDENHTLMLTLNPCRGDRERWHEFKVSSKMEDTWVDHCKGLVQIESYAPSVASEEKLRSLEYPVTADLWYKVMGEAGYSFGKTFQKQLQIESVAGSQQSRSLVDLSPPITEYKESKYAMHPVCIDGCFQAAAPSLWKGHRSAVNAVLVPAMIDDMILVAPKTEPKMAMAVGSSEFVGIGRPEETKNYKSNVEVYDEANGILLMQLSGLQYHKLDTREDVHSNHSYTRVAWKPEVEYLDQGRLDAALEDVKSEDVNELDFVLDVLSHKKPSMKVMELSMNLPEETKSAWCSGRADEPRFECCRQLFFGSNNANSLLETQERYAARSGIEYSLLDATKPDFECAEKDFDLVILKIPASLSNEDVCIKNAKMALAEAGYLLVMRHKNNRNDLQDSPDPMAFRADTPNGIFEPVDATKGLRGLSILPKHADLAKISSIVISLPENNVDIVPSSSITLIDLTKNTTTTDDAAKGALEKRGWSVFERSLPWSDLPTETVVVLDDPSKPLLPNVTGDQWTALQTLLQGGSSILWVTAGGQMQVTDPMNAMFHGFARSIRAEDPNLNLMVLDVESISGPNTWSAIEFALKKLAQARPEIGQEAEYTERGNIVFTSRVLVDESSNRVEKNDQFGAELIKRPLHAAKQCLRLRCERLGTLDCLHYGEIAPEEIPLLGDNYVEVELYAAGLNFKDVAVTMGIVPENQYLLGLEGAGVVRRVGKSASQFHVGQRVLVHKKGCFANRVQATTDGVYPLPDDMSYEEASTLACVYLVSIYGLYHLANLQKGQTVLIHSAAGGVGIASIQLAQHKGAEIFATVGSTEKRKFLTDNFGIPDDHIFSSRNTDFAPALMEITKGLGVNVILNSLTGPILEESWRCIADGGNMIEIGKKDILDRNSLSMEPFNRNASFRAVDMSHKSIDDPLTGRLLHELFELIRTSSHVKPIKHIKTFPFDDIPAAFRYMRGGNHIGKIVITNGPDAEVEVPVRPAQTELKLNPQRSYLIVGGLKGLCGSLAIYLAKCGAGSLVVMSRSGCDNEKSQAVIKNINALGCEIQTVTGDVANFADVKKAFSTARYPISGIIQGAMVLRDRIFGGMSVEDFHAAIEAKVKGTWNLHHASMEQEVPLDYFTMLSSISGVIGQKAQANYAAANVFLDAFSEYRHSLGLRSCTVDLGVIEDVGYIAERAQLAARLDNSLWNQGINEALLHKILKMSILQQTSPDRCSNAQLITGIPVPQTENSALLRDARFAGLCVRDSDGVQGGDAGQDASKDVQAFFLLLRSKADAAAVLESAIGVVNKQFTTALALSEPMEPAKPLSSYGLDSLAAVEFRNWVKTKLGVELTTLEITNAKSLTTLCEKIISKIAPVA